MATNAWLAMTPEQRGMLLAQNAPQGNMQGDVILNPADFGNGAFSVPADQSPPIPPVTEQGGSQRMRVKETVTEKKRPMQDLDVQYQALMDSLNQKELDSLKNQGLTIENLQGKIAEMDQRDLPLNLQPIAALVDSWTGSKFAPYAQAEETRASREAAKAKLQDQVLRAQQGLSENEIGLLRSRLNNQFQVDNLLHKRELDAQSAEMERRKLGLMEKGLGIKEAKAGQPGKLNKDQWQAGLFGKRMEDADTQMEDLYGDPSTQMYLLGSEAALQRKAVPEELQNETLKKANQAERNFVNATLRRESGAAISNSEFANAEKQYFPRYGDTPEVLAQKAQNRKRQIEGFRLESAGAWNQFSPMEDPLKGGASGGGGGTDLLKQLEAEKARRAGGRK